MKIKQAPLSKFVVINPEVITQGYPYQTIEYIDISSVGSGQLVEQPEEILLKDAPSRAKRIVRNKDIILATVRPNLRSFLFIKNPNNNTIVSTGFAVLRAKETANSRFIYYCIIDDKFTGYLTNNTKGTSYPAVDSDIVLRGEIPDFDLKKQQYISDILSTYDDLIDTNRRRIQLLEESARLLFREWFVYFRFPGHEIETQNLASVRLVDGVPEGWNKEKINKLVAFKRGVEPGSDNYLETYESGSFPFFRVSDLITRSPSIFVDEQYAKSALLKKSDIVVSLDGSVGIVSMGLEGCYSTGIRKLVIKDKKINRAYLYFLMKSHYVQGVINAYAKGTTIQHAGEAIKHMNPTLPPQNLMDLFDEIVSPALNEILILLEQNQKLAQARDLLLPRLMSGAIEV
ncbi:MAG: restriction endonuclease subunit S [Candidatus Omnitrophica bacterium]|nr:restriction endonuclease subunit S [Candidatus Omnitrophota bacterium]MBU4478660.1 restriction endonuclease subunit S [Candidatus Omnitrophota bacterium]